MMGVLNQNEWMSQWIRSDLELFDFQKELSNKICIKISSFYFSTLKKTLTFALEVFIFKIIFLARVAEMADALDLGSSTFLVWGFDSPLSHKFKIDVY